MSTPTQALTPEQLYQLIKEYEAEIPIPAPFVTIDVGTFDAATGKFTGLTTLVINDPEPLEHEPGQSPINPAPRFEGAEYVTVSIDARWRETVTREPAPVVPVDHAEDSGRVGSVTTVRAQYLSQTLRIEG